MDITDIRAEMSFEEWKLKAFIYAKTWNNNFLSYIAKIFKKNLKL